MLVNQHLQTPVVRKQETSDETIEEAEIMAHEQEELSRSFYQRIYLMLEAGSIEGLKVVFPSASIPIEIIKELLKIASCL